MESGGNKVRRSVHHPFTTRNNTMRLEEELLSPKVKWIGYSVESVCKTDAKALVDEFSILCVVSKKRARRARE